ncbi:hypothetical protein HAL07_06680 [Helicobacter ailurogastricus]|uniref:Uncharacterized protein n=1 Tax=Helicobacter ailurogastricus TaxID=1578720 RepID=A0A0K2Y6K4_9HELI|nr:hypothetical protein HAL07_06680 [Helicobacter ailurogastricus]
MGLLWPCAQWEVVCWISNHNFIVGNLGHMHALLSKAPRPIFLYP